MPVFACSGAVKAKDSPYGQKLFHRAIGVPPRQIYTYKISNPGNCSRVHRVDGRVVAWPEMSDPYVPATFGEPFHPGGNSLCYMAQIAHILGAEQVYALGFTMQQGSAYFFGREHPLRGGGSFYDTDRALHWLSWYESAHPGRLKLLPGFEGPVYDVLKTEDLDVYRERVAREGPESEGSAAPAPVAGEVHAVGGHG